MMQFYSETGFIELEGGDLLLLESSGSLFLESNDKVNFVEDGADDAVLFASDPALWFQYIAPYFSLALFSPTHFGPNADAGIIKGPTTFETIEGPNDFEIRTPL